MSKGLEAIKQAQASEGGGTKSRRSYLKKGESVLVRIPETVIDNLTVKKVVSVWEKFLPTLSYSANNVEGKRDLYAEASKMMLDDHFRNQAKGVFAKGSAEDKASYKAARQLDPKPLYLFGVYPLEDFTQGKNTYEAGEPLVFETNNGRDGANIDALVSTLQKLEKKFNTKAFEISCAAANKYTILPVDIEDLTPEQKKVFDATEGLEVADEVFDEALFESDTQKQAKDLVAIGFDVSRLGVEITEDAGEPAEGDSLDISDEDIPF